MRGRGGHTEERWASQYWPCPFLVSFGVIDYGGVKGRTGSCCRQEDRESARKQDGYCGEGEESAKERDYCNSKREEGRRKKEQGKKGLDGRGYKMEWEIEGGKRERTGEKERRGGYAECSHALFPGRLF